MVWSAHIHQSSCKVSAMRVRDSTSNMLDTLSRQWFCGEMYAVRCMRSRTNWNPSGKSRSSFGKPGVRLSSKFIARYIVFEVCCSDFWLLVFRDLQHLKVFFESKRMGERNYYIFAHD